MKQTKPLYQGDDWEICYESVPYSYSKIVDKGGVNGMLNLTSVGDHFQHLQRTEFLRYTLNIKLMRTHS